MREILPWDHIDLGVARWHLVTPWRRAQGLQPEPREPEPREREKLVLLHDQDLVAVRR